MPWAACRSVYWRMPHSRRPSRISTRETQLLIVTDGLPRPWILRKARSATPRIEELVVRRRPAGVGLLSMLLAGVRAFEAGSPPADDMAAILLRIEDALTGADQCSKTK